MKKGLKQSLRAVLFLAFAALLLVLSFRGIDFAELWTVMRKANYLWLLPAVAFSILSFIIRARRWILLIEPLGSKPGLASTSHAVVTGYFANMIFPRLGEVAKCAALGKKENIPFDRLVGTMLIERTVDILTVLVLLAVTLIAGSTATGTFLSENVFGPAEEKITSSFGSATVITVIVLLLAITAVVMFFMLRERLSGYPVFKKLYSFSDGLLAGLKSILRLRRRWEFLLLTLLLWVSYFFMSYFPLLCLESTSGLGVEATLFILIIGSFGMAAPVQSGLGAYHWIVSRGMLVAYGIPLEEGLAYATLEHESQMILIAIMGAISLYALFGKKGGKVLSSVVAEKEI
ncbi:MAG: flippase-like domain-containing protein [Bacteroidales bacterium]|nr:flippase-like domain-containing protein [Bacteroidales bacterium]MDD3736576.1 lysylphosphatidylglycerol synthase transmembrane domain-containing protein [Bacteroidales bacterium]HNT93791.1 lysylphosphatidylglycerol synthase transmembrane domain-containing protein [Bacteroidales bacterium]HOO67190.1 lysylphosphatidylglycerol synthase transmembrane domain-containing protein [Bacteroidales bacterium]HPE23112.1 lysylphosphatidylglycerol synthase transmembrane domain-containing protein [Bacteroid